MGGERIAKSTQEQAVAAWIDFRNVLRLQELAEKIANQDINFESAMDELQKLKIFVSNPTHILGYIKQKHGEIAEHVQVAFMNAEQRIVGEAASHTFEGVGRLAPEDYLRFGKMVQSKFYMGVSGTLTAIADHLDAYPWFLDEGGSYDIAKNQYNELMRIYEGGAAGTLNNSDTKLYAAIKEWESLHKVKFDEVVHPSVVNYEDVQLDTVHNTIQQEEAKIEEQDQQQRAQAHAEAKPTLKDGVKVTATAALLEGGVAFVIGVYKKKKAGKKIAEFTKEDWKELGIDTGVGTGKGAIRGGTVYVLSNFASVPAPMASAMVTATLGMLAQAYKLNNGDITAEEFVDASEAICLDVTMSAVSSMLGEILIPIPVLGAIIGNTVGMFMMSIARNYLSAEEQKLIEGYQKEMSELKNHLDAEYKSLVEKLEAEIAKYDSLAQLAFDADVNVRFESIISRAKLVGANTERLVDLEAGAALFTSGKPVVL
ncbi:MAG: hypothetical protein ACI4OB_05585 [Christensenellales bacterium]